VRIIPHLNGKALRIRSKLKVSCAGLHQKIIRQFHSACDRIVVLLIGVFDDNVAISLYIDAKADDLAVKPLFESLPLM